MVSENMMYCLYLSTTAPARGGPVMAATPLVKVSRPNPAPRPESDHTDDGDNDDYGVTSDAEQGDEGRGHGGHPEAGDQPEH